MMAESVKVDHLNELHKRTSMMPPMAPLAIPAADSAKSDKKTGKETKKKSAKKDKKKGKIKETPSQPVDEDPLKMKVFFTQVDGIRQNLDKLENNCSLIEDANRRIITSTSEKEISNQESIIASCLSISNQISSSIKDQLQEIENDTDRLKGLAPAGSGDLRMRIVNHAALAKKFSEIMKRIQDIQNEASTKHQAQVERQYLIMRPDANEQEISQVTQAVGAMTLSPQQIFSLGQTRDPLKTLEDMKERRKQVMDIEKSLVTLHQLFVDLGNIVEEQQGMLDNLEEYMGQTVEYMEEAEDNMQEAVESQRNIRRLKCVIGSRSESETEFSASNQNASFQ